MINIAAYACKPTFSKGREYKENEDIEDIFLRDREKIIHSSAFRRVEYKTQVFVNHVGDHYRTRLTHTIEVSQIARILSRKLNLNEDLTETIALSHDLGHPPFGHAGEDGLDDAAKNFGGFDHNVQTVKLLLKLEHRYANFNGLNLSFEALEGIAKHNGPINNLAYKPHLMLSNLLKNTPIDLTSQPSLEAQCAAFADDIAYINHDIDDGLRASMFCLDELESLPLICQILNTLRKNNIYEPTIKHELIRQLSKLMIEDLVLQTLTNIKLYGIKTYEDIKSQDLQILTFSDEVHNAKNVIKNFLMQKVYRNYRVNRMSQKAKDLINNLFIRYLQNPDCLPTEWYAKILDKTNSTEIADNIINYIAGMTDRFAIEEYKRLFDPSLF